MQLPQCIYSLDTVCLHSTTIKYSNAVMHGRITAEIRMSVLAQGVQLAALLSQLAKSAHESTLPEPQGHMQQHTQS